MQNFNMAERQQIESKLKKCFILAKKSECPFRIDCSHRVYQLPRFGWKNFQVNSRMSPDYAPFFIFQGTKIPLVGL